MGIYSFKQDGNSTVSLAIIASLIFFFCNERLEKHDGSCLSARALYALEDMHQFLHAIVVVRIWGKQACRSINCFSRDFKCARNGYQCGGLWFALSIEKLIDYGSI